MKELIEKQAVIDALLSKMDTIDDKPEVVLGLAVAAGMIKDMPSALEQEPCDDCIRRSDIGLTDFEMVMCNGDYKEALKMLLDKIEKAPSVTPAEKQEICEDYISRSSIKQKLQEHHDFFVNAYGGFSNLPQNDKSRVDEITNCIAMVVNEPSVTPAEKAGHWIEERTYMECPKCHDIWHYEENQTERFKCCPNCGAKMEVEG